MALGSKRIIRNESAEAILISELGISILPGYEKDLLTTRTLLEISQANSLLPFVLSGDAVFNDGDMDYPAADAVRILFQITESTPSSYDGKSIVQASPRPLNPKTYTHWTGAGDDINLGVRGAGEKLILTISGSEQEKTKDCYFLTDSLCYLRQAYVSWEGAPLYSTISADMYALPTILTEVTAGSGILSIDGQGRIVLTPSGNYVFGYPGPWPVPAYDYNGEPNGFWDIHDFNLLPTSSGTGSYNLYPVEVKVGTFLNEFNIYKDNYQPLLLDSDDIELIAPGYFLRLTAKNSPVDPKDFTVLANLVMYKQDIS